MLVLKAALFTVTISLVRCFDKNIDCRDLPDKGTCNGAMNQWYYVPSIGKCATFSYSGCGGNFNRHRSEAECMASCGGVSAASSGNAGGNSANAPGRNPPGLAKRLSAGCYKPIDTGCYNARAVQLRWFFDAAKRSCQSFYYCKEDWQERNFPDLDACANECGGPGSPTTSSQRPTPPEETTIIAITTAAPTTVAANNDTDDEGAAPDPASLKYVRQSGQCVGTILKGYPTNDVETCAQRCEEYVVKGLYTCVGFNVHSFTIRCDLIANCDYKTDGLPSYLRDPQALNRYTAVPNTRCSGDVIRTYNIASAGQCAQNCERYQIYQKKPCVGFGLFPSETKCQLFANCKRRSQATRGESIYNRMSFGNRASTQTYLTQKTTPSPTVLDKYARQSEMCVGNILQSYSVVDDRLCALYCERYQIFLQQQCIGFRVYAEQVKCDLISGDCSQTTPTTDRFWYRTAPKTAQPQPQELAGSASPAQGAAKGALARYYPPADVQCADGFTKTFTTTDAEVCAQKCNDEGKTCVAFTLFPRESQCNLHAVCDNKSPSINPSQLRIITAMDHYTKQNDQCANGFVKTYKGIDTETCAVNCDKLPNTDNKNCIGFTVYPNEGRCDLHAVCVAKVQSNTPSYLRSP